MAVDLAGDVALEDAHDLRLGASVGEAAFDVGAGARIGAHAGEHDAPQSVIRLAVAAAVESMADGLAGRGVDRGDPAEVGEGASEVIRSALSPAATSSSAAVCTPTPDSSSRLGAVARTRWVSSPWRWCSMCPAGPASRRQDAARCED